MKTPKSFLFGLGVGLSLGLSGGAVAGWSTPPKWEPVEAPYGAPKGTMCWVHGGGWGDTAWGGPWCYVPAGVAR